MKKVFKNKFSYLTKKIFLLAMLFCYFFTMIPLAQAEESLSSKQIVYEGGTNDAKWDSEYVKVSKKIKGTGTEDEFDITLTVQTKNDIESIISNERVAVVIVTDLSNTMKSGIDGKDLCPNSPLDTKTCVKNEITDDIFKKMKAGKAVAEIQKIATEFAKSSSGISGNEIGVVGFNTNGYEIQAMKDLTSYNVTTFNNNVYNNIKKKMKSYEASDDPNRFTNIEAGLKMAKYWLDTRSQKHKYIIFLSDGLPTTYLKDNQTCSNDNNCTGKYADDYGTPTTIYSELIDKIRNRRTEFGSNYSDTAAAKARMVAMDLKRSGVEILSVGVGLSTFNGTKQKDVKGITFGEESIVNKLNGEQMIVNQIHRSFLKKVSTIENDFTASTFEAALKQNWELLRDFSGLSATNYYWDGTNPEWYTRDGEIKLSTDYNTTKNARLFEKWLQYGIGSGSFWDATDDKGLIDAVSSIIDDLKESLSKISRVWTTTDPMATIENKNHELESYIEFKEFIKADGTTTTAPLIGTSGKNNTNTASYTANDVSGTINWDLKNSGYQTSVEEGKTIYTYQLKYKVRLKVEKDGFEANKPYDTNDPTTLTYALNINGVLGEDKIINYPIPKVKGFLEELKIEKKVQGLTYKDDNLKFDFTVTFKDANNDDVKKRFAYDKYNADGSVAHANQGINSGDSFYLRDGQYVIIHNLYHGITYEVKETPKEGFASSVLSGNYTDTTNSDTSLYEVTYLNKAYQLKLKKYDKDTSKPLNGVTFTLYKNHENGRFSNPVTNMNGTQLKNIITSSGTIDLGNIPFATSGNTIYYLVEEDTIDRYNLLDSYIKVIVNSEGITTQYNGEDANIQISHNGSVYEISVPNTIGVNLPETGGRGSTIFTISGMLTLIIASAYYIFYKKSNLINKEGI